MRLYISILLMIFVPLLFVSLTLSSCEKDKEKASSASKKEDKAVEQEETPAETKKEEKPIPSFTDVMKQSGLGKVGYLGQTSSWADFNNDGNLDLLMGNTDLRNTSLFLFKNTGGKFVNIFDESDIFPEPVRSSAWADYDNDGYIDVLIGTIRAAYPPKLYRNIKGEYFEEMTEKAGLMIKTGTVRHSIWGDYNADGYVDIFRVNFGNNHLYKNNGDGTFTEVSGKAGIVSSDRSDSAVFTDLNNDGKLDLFVANSGKNRLYINNGDGTFRDETEKSGIGGEPGWSSICTCTADYNNDGNMDVYIGNISGSRNALYRNNGDGTFTDVTTEAGTPDVGDARTCVWLDFDNDGYVDLFTTNHTATNNLYRNLGNGKFENLATELGVRRPVDVYSVSVGDYNNDSLLDMILTGHLGKALLKHGGDSNTSLVIELKGDGKNTNLSAIGTKVILKTSGNQQVREVSGGRGCCEQDMLPVHFGLGTEKKADITVVWTDGSKCEFSDYEVETDSTISISQQDCKISKKF